MAFRSFYFSLLLCLYVFLPNLLNSIALTEFKFYNLYIWVIEIKQKEFLLLWFDFSQLLPCESSKLWDLQLKTLTTKECILSGHSSIYLYLFIYPSIYLLLSCAPAYLSIGSVASRPLSYHAFRQHIHYRVYVHEQGTWMFWRHYL